MATSVFLASDLTSWYNRINEVRQRPGISIGAITVPSVQNTLARAATMDEFKSQILALKSNTHLGKADYTGIENLNISSGVAKLESQKINIDSTIQSLEGICANKVTTQCSDKTDNSKCSDKTDDAQYSDYSDDGRSTNSDNNRYNDDYDHARYTDECADRSRNTDWVTNCPVQTEHSNDSDMNTTSDSDDYDRSDYTDRSENSNTTDSDDRDYSDRSNCSDNTNYSKNTVTCSDQSVCSTFAQTGNSVTTYTV